MFTRPSDDTQTGATAPHNPFGQGLGAGLRLGLLAYGLSSAAVVLAVLQAGALLRPEVSYSPAEDIPTNGQDEPFVGLFARWDGAHYTRICEDGYQHEQGGSNVGFFPVYPLLGRLLHALPGVSAAWALLLVSHLCLLGAMVLLAAYIKLRFPEAPDQLTWYVVLALAFMPAGFFFRMVYSESLFLLLTILTFYLIERNGPAPLVALIVGCLTATRPAGIALLGPFLLYLGRRSPTWGSFVMRAAWLLPIALSGLGLYALNIFVEFGDPWILARHQMKWSIQPPASWPEKIYALAILKPCWSILDASSPCYWKRHDAFSNPCLSLYLANPFFFLGTAGLVVLGACKNWLTSYEWVLALLLLLIPYAGLGHPLCMVSTARYAAVVFPVYLVLGQLLCRLPTGVALGAVAFNGLLLAFYSARFSLWHPYFY